MAKKLKTNKQKVKNQKKQLLKNLKNQDIFLQKDCLIHSSQRLKSKKGLFKQEKMR